MCLWQVLGSGRDAYTVLRGLRFDHKAEELFARASQLVIGLGSLFYLLRHMRTPWPNSNTKSEKFIPEDRVSPRYLKFTTRVQITL